MGSRTGAADLTSRLDATDIRNIIKMISEGSSITAICKAYHFSYSSLVRILTPWDWSQAQKHNWEYDTLPDIVWPSNTARPKKTYPPVHTPATAGYIRQKNTEFETASDDASRYAKENTAQLPDTVEITTLSDLVIEDDLRKGVESLNSPYHDKLPELDHLFPTARDRINRKELEHRMESVQLCFDLMEEEFAKLQALVDRT